MINKNYTYAIVGASANPEKYGYKVLADLLSAGYKVMPVNPRGGEILEQKVFEDLAELPNLPDVVIFVVQPQVAFQVLQKANELGIKKFWFQPGSESEEAKEYCREENLEAVFNACIMIQR
jgi:hypothetical protein